MANCKFCGKSAGFFRWQHHDCRIRHDDGAQKIFAMIESSEGTPQQLPDRIKNICEQSLISAPESKAIVLKAWLAKVDHALDDHLLTDNEEEWLAGVKETFGFAQDELDKTGALTRLAKAAIIRDLANGKIPHHMHIAGGTLPFVFQKDEELIWVFQGVDYLEDKTRRQYVGGSSGVSVRVVRGVYYRVGSFRGHPIDYTERVRVDTGILATTNKNIYFGGTTKALRIPFRKVVSFLPFNDGAGVIRDAASAKPQIFVTHDGWFTFNLWSNISRL